jgi:hypothetical protein
MWFGRGPLLLCDWLYEPRFEVLFLNCVCVGVCLHVQACINAYAVCAYVHIFPPSFRYTFNYDTTKCRTILVWSTPCFPNALLSLYMPHWLWCSFNVGQICYLQKENIFFPWTQLLFFLVVVVFDRKKTLKGKKSGCIW